ncbi:lipoyl protein ligase domain-containing protein [Sulfobacillus thermosulfidooxidans]|uniref:lipoyl protein ligase domain-containing protein n=1 Tax=Sulfobacillus thermosulfidooxidans TaxID=28034 RepID=UPI0006B56256|nr:lipoate--protein ligase family protein [Sulfobacillus thermosulfidooxidans]
MRYLDLGTVKREMSQAVYHALAQRLKPHDEITLVTVSPDRPYVCVGYHQLASREIDREFCETHQILVGRRFVGGGAVYLDHGQVFWHLLLPKPRGPVEDMYREILKAPIETYQQMGINAQFRPVNDIVVGPRKIGGTGASTMGTTTVIVGSLLFDFNVALMARVLKVPSEKFRDKMISSLSEYMTTINQELGEPPERQMVVAKLVDNFSRLLNEPVHADQLSSEEEADIEKYALKLFDPEFVYRGERGLFQSGIKIRSGVYLHEGVFKAPGGLLRLIYRVNDGVFDDVNFSGDFFMDPWDSSAVEDFQRYLCGRLVNEHNVEEASRQLFEKVSIPGVVASDIVECFRRAESTQQSPVL